VEIKPAISQKQAREILWRQGNLRFLLDTNQQGLYDAFYSTKSRRVVFNCGRRVGKSYLLCLLSIEHAIRLPGASIFYTAPTKDQCKRIIWKIFKKILIDCPQDISPVWLSQDRIFEFPNGSTISLGAMDSGRADSIRGSDAALAVVDEAGFSPSHYVTEMIEGVLRPMTLLTRGKIIIASTPAKTPRHAFEKYFNNAKLEGAAFHRTIYDNPRLSPEDIAEEIKAAGGEHTTYWKREYLAQHVIDEEIITFPEFDAEKQNELVQLVDKPPYYDAYTSIDLGIKDATGILFFYWDFKNARLVVEDEGLLQGIKEVRSDLIANLIKDKEKALWGDKQPYFRMSDSDLGSQLMINELDVHHGLRFVVSDKDSKEAAVNEMRLMLKNNQIIIHPRCTNLIAQIAGCVWDKGREKFDRIDGFYHFDLVDALLYGIRGIRRQHNPYPSERYNSSSQFFYSQPSEATANAKIFESIFGLKKKS
jgi:hypothetical protein